MLHVVPFFIMAKDPAFLFYYDRFLSGTFTMSNEQVGMYIRLLCIQANKGHVSKNDMFNICKTYDLDIANKFVSCGQDIFKNEVLEQIMKDRAAYTESRRTNRLGKKPTYDKHMKNISTTYDNHMVIVDVNKNVNKDVDENENLKTQKIEIENPFGLAGKRIWEAWKAYKKDEHKKTYKSAKTEQTALNSLYEMSGGNVEIAGQIIQQSITNQWQGFFELKKQNNVKPTKSLREQVAEEFAKRYPD